MLTYIVCIFFILVYWAGLYLDWQQSGYISFKTIVVNFLISILVTILFPGGIICIFMALEKWFNDPKSIINRKIFVRKE